MTKEDDQFNNLAEQKQQRILVPGYSGVPFESIPQRLRDRVQAAVKEAIKGDRRFMLTVYKVGDIWPIEFAGYTDVFVADQAYHKDPGEYHNSFHRAEDGYYRAFLTGLGTHEAISAIGTALGFDPQHAIPLPNFGYMEFTPNVGWTEKPGTSSPQRRYFVSGPFYGQ